MYRRDCQEQQMTVQRSIQSSFAKMLIPVIMAILLGACGGGGGGETASTDTSTSTSSTSNTFPPASSVSTSSATIGWTAPVARADQTPLSLADIGGYRVYYGASEGDYTNSIDVDDGTAEQVTLTELPLGTYYFVVTTYDVDGRESVYSPVVIKKI